MANSRIKDIATTAAAAASDDYLVIDGSTNGTRKLSANNIGGEKEYDFTTSLTPSIDARGVSGGLYNITPASAADLTASNGTKIRAYLASGTTIYPLIPTYISVSTSYFSVTFKSINASVQITSSTTISGTLHIVAPFEISAVVTSM